MKNSYLLLVTTLLMTILVSFPAYAKQDQALVITNHYDKPIDFTITINPDVVPNLTSQFSLGVNASIKTPVLDTGKEAYIAGDERGNTDHFVFWGVEATNNKLEFHGYMARDIAYSWTANSITFCKTEDYQQNHRCL